MEFVTIYQGSIFDLSCDAVVSLANSFGFMDGGIDMLYTQHFGWKVQERVQEAIRERHHGGLLVGQAEIVETDNPALPFLIAAPTMRVPMILRDSVNLYLAARAACCSSSTARSTAAPTLGRRSPPLWTAWPFPPGDGIFSRSGAGPHFTARC